MARIYVGVGHGMTSRGVFDPGAVAPDGTQEHALNHRVVDALEAALRRSGVTDLVVEHDSGVSHDVDYVGSTKAVNAGNFDLAIEVHFDSANAAPGGFGIYANEQSRGKDWAARVNEVLRFLGMPAKANYADRRGLYFLQQTRCPALIWECDPVGAHSDDVLFLMGEAIAAGTCHLLGIEYVPFMAAPAPDAWERSWTPAPDLGPVALGDPTVPQWYKDGFGSYDEWRAAYPNGR